MEMSATKLKQMGGRIEKISEEQITTFGEEIKTLINTEIEKKWMSQELVEMWMDEIKWIESGDWLAIFNLETAIWYS